MCAFPGALRDRHFRRRHPTDRRHLSPIHRTKSVRWPPAELVTANFAPVNLVDDVASLFHKFATLIQPGGRVLAAVLNPWFTGDLRYGWWWRGLPLLLARGRYAVAGAQAPITRWLPGALAAAASDCSSSTRFIARPRARRSVRWCVGCGATPRSWPPSRRVVSFSCCSGAGCQPDEARRACRGPSSAAAMAGGRLENPQQLVRVVLTTSTYERDVTGGQVVLSLAPLMIGVSLPDGAIPAPGSLRFHDCRSDSSSERWHCHRQAPSSSLVRASSAISYAPAVTAACPPPRRPGNACC